MAALCLRVAGRTPLPSAAASVSTSLFRCRTVVSVANADGSLSVSTAERASSECMPASVLRKQLLYRSKQRGWLELDLIMGSWAEQNLERLTGSELQQYEAVVRRENPDLMKWLVERVAVPVDADNAVMQQIITYAHGAGKSWIRKKGNQA